MKKENMNDKGFSLVELIIVIAIMAILIVVLAPQYLKYVERSRNSTDMQNVTTIKTAIETYAADPQAASVIAANFDIDVTNTNITCTNADVWAALTDAALVSGASPSTDIKCSSKNSWASYQIHGEPQSNGSIKWSYKSFPQGSTSDNGSLASKMKGGS